MIYVSKQFTDDWLLQCFMRSLCIIISTLCKMLPRSLYLWEYNRRIILNTNLNCFIFCTWMFLFCPNLRLQIHIWLHWRGSTVGTVYQYCWLRNYWLIYPLIIQCKHYHNFLLGENQSMCLLTQHTSNPWGMHPQCSR